MVVALKYARAVPAMEDDDTLVNRFLDFLNNSLAAAVLAGSALVFLPLHLIPALHPISWIMGVLQVAVAALAVWLILRRYQRDQARIDHLNAELGAEREKMRTITRELGEFRPIADETSEDVQASRRIVGQLSSAEGLIPWLRVRTDLTSWAPEQLDPMEEFLHANRQLSFEDSAVHTAFMELYRAAQQLRDWFSLEGSRHGDDGWELLPADQREGGWREFTEAKARGEELADTLLTARAGFERVALERGTLPT